MVARPRLLHEHAANAADGDADGGLPAIVWEVILAEEPRYAVPPSPSHAASDPEPSAGPWPPSTAASCRWLGRRSPKQAVERAAAQGGLVAALRGAR